MILKLIQGSQNAIVSNIYVKWAHLRPRTNIIGAVARVRHCLAQAIHRFFHEQGFYWVATPLITASDTEGAGEMFRVSTLT